MKVTWQRGIGGMFNSLGMTMPLFIVDPDLSPDMWRFYIALVVMLTLTSIGEAIKELPEDGS